MLTNIQPAGMNNSLGSGQQLNSVQPMPSTLGTNPNRIPAPNDFLGMAMRSQQPNQGVQSGDFGSQLIAALFGPLGQFFGGQGNGMFGQFGGFRPDSMGDMQMASGNPATSGLFSALMSLFGGRM